MIKHPFFDPGPSVVVKWERTTAPPAHRNPQLARKVRVPDPRRGMDNTKAKLTDDDVREMRRLYEIKELKHNPSAWNAKCRLKKEMLPKYTIEQIAKRFGVARETARRIIKRERWTHID